MGKVLIDESTLTDIADSIRSKKGTTDLINPANYASEISGITGGGGSSIENGFTVNFHDAENNLVQSVMAIYGYEIYAPASHMVDHWEDETGKTIQFPLTVTADSGIDEYNVCESGPSTCERAIYNYFGISKLDYPLLAVKAYTGSAVRVVFAQANASWRVDMGYQLVITSSSTTCLQTYSTSKPTSNSIAATIQAILSGSGELSAPSNVMLNSSAKNENDRLYTNFDVSITDGRLDEIIYDDGSQTLIHPYALQEKVITSSGEVVPDEGYYGLSKVIVNIGGN